MYVDAKDGRNFFSSVKADTIVPFILKIALSDTAVSSKAVLHAILALSCLHLGRYDDAVSYKHKSLSFAAKSLKPGADPKMAFENIAAHLLLYTYEVLHPCFS